jgi:ribonuclease Z
LIGVTILGNNSALPAFDRHPTSQIVTIDDQLLMIDCGEGTQMQMSRYKIKRGKINHIFISHLHGDHYFGLIGVITSMGLLGREHALNLYAPATLLEIINLQLKVASTTLPFQLNFIPIEKNGLLCAESKFTVHCFAVKHRIDCWGFRIAEKKNPRKIDREKTLQYEIPTAFYERLKLGEDYTNKEGELIKNEWVTTPNTETKVYCYCADTIYDETMVAHVRDCHLLYHETTYLHDLKDRAAARFHSTTEQAATIAVLANAKKLIIGHFSSKYESLEDFLKEATAVFANTELAIEGVSYAVR